ncbi:MAG: hypothetical protein ACKPKO_39230, partial [Candidatus Fonsibacter sp.]
CNEVGASLIGKGLRLQANLIGRRAGVDFLPAVADGDHCPAMALQSDVGLDGAPFNFVHYEGNVRILCHQPHRR